jgi:RimJ/RimL family protein N-acetyltransferase
LCWPLPTVSSGQAVQNRNRALHGQDAEDSIPINETRLETPRLSLRLMDPCDLDDLLKIFGDPKVMAAYNTIPFTRPQMEHWLQRNIAHQDTHGYGLFSVLLRSQGLLIGDCGLEHMEVEGKSETELGYDFKSDYWNKGFATEAATAVCDFAFYALHLPSLISLIRVGNSASQRVSEKIGMQLVDEITQNGVRYWKYAIDGSSNIHS